MRKTKQDGERKIKTRAKKREEKRKYEAMRNTTNKERKNIRTKHGGRENKRR